MQHCPLAAIPEPLGKSVVVFLSLGDLYLHIPVPACNIISMLVHAWSLLAGTGILAEVHAGTIVLYRLESCCKLVSIIIMA